MKSLLAVLRIVKKGQDHKINEKNVFLLDFVDKGEKALLEVIKNKNSSSKREIKKAKADLKKIFKDLPELKNKSKGWK